MTGRKDNFKVRCPRCGIRVEWKDNPQRPFCSEKCRMVDLGRWSEEEYRIPGRKTDIPDEDKVVAFPRKDQD